MPDQMKEAVRFDRAATLFSTAQVAVLANVSTWTVRRAESDGALTRSPVPGNARYAEHEVARFLGITMDALRERVDRICRDQDAAKKSGEAA